MNRTRIHGVNPFARFRTINDLECHHGEPLQVHTSMKMQSTAALLAIAHTPYALRDAVRVARDEHIPWMVLGGGTNTLFATGYYDGMIIKLGREFENFELLRPEWIRAGAGLDFKKLVAFSIECGLTGLEFGAGIPGTIGGAAAGNAGARDEAKREQGLCDFIDNLLCMDRQGNVWTVRRGEFLYTYRASELREVIILEMDFRLSHATAEVIHQKSKFYREQRKGQPYSNPSCGCMFKNPVNPQSGQSVSAGKLIDELGLKGYRVGDAQISPKHANFMINLGDAAAEDFLALISLTQDMVRIRTGIELDMEVKVIGGPLHHAYV